MMVLADLDDILIRASYSSEMRSSSISEVSMEVAVPNYSGLAQALEVEQCRCPPGYQGLSCQVTLVFKAGYLKSKSPLQYQYHMPLVIGSDFTFVFCDATLKPSQVIVVRITIITTSIPSDNILLLTIPF